LKCELYLNLDELNEEKIVRMNAHDIKSYPKLAYYVKNDMPKIIDVPSIVLAMSKVGQINKPKLRLALSWGSGPTIRIVGLIDAYGEFTPDKQSNEIRIDTKLVKEFESGKGKRAVRAGHVFLVGVTLLHELVHWGDDKDGIDRPGEEGAEFENMTYGSVVY